MHPPYRVVNYFINSVKVPGHHCDRSMKTSVHDTAAVTKANKVLGCIRNRMKNNTENIIVPFYKSMLYSSFGILSGISTSKSV